MSYADTPIHELPEPDSYVKAIEDYYGTEVIVTDDIYSGKLKGWAIYLTEESMDGTPMHYTTQDTSKCTYIGNMTTDVQDLWDDLESDIMGGYKVAIYNWFAEELNSGDTAEDICEEVWGYACATSRVDAEKKAKLNLSNLEVDES